MKFKITYRDAGDHPRTKEVEAETEQDAIDLLADDEQHPLAQVDQVEIVEDECEHKWHTDENGEWCIKCYHRKDE